MAAVRSPLHTLEKFDSLMERSQYDSARALCTGEAARIFDFLVFSNEKILPLVDEEKSLSSYSSPVVDGAMAVVRSRNKVVFKKPLMGMDSLTSFTAVFLIERSHSWKISGFLELASEQAEIAGKSPINETDSPDAGGFFFPASSAWPEIQVNADSAEFLVNVRSAGSLSGIIAEDWSQKILGKAGDKGWKVRTIRLPTPAGNTKKPPGAEYESPTDYFNLGDTLLLSALPVALQNANTRADSILGICRWVSGHISFRMGASLFSTSAEILRNPEGDCSEAAVLSAAMLRAAGIPSRVCIGLALADSGCFIGHAWTEAWDNGWIGMDPALRQFPAGALRIKLAALSGSEDLRACAVNALLKVISNLDVEITGLWKNGTQVKLNTHNKKSPSGLQFLRDLFEAPGTQGKPKF